MRDYLFEKEIRLFGLKRSGNSGIISFITEHYEPYEYIHLHNTDFSFRPRSRRALPTEFWDRLGMQDLEHLKMFLNSSEHNLPNFCHFKVIYDKLNDNNYSYNLDAKYTCEYYGFKKSNFGEEKYNILLIRSPHNNLASFLRMLELRKGFRKQTFYEFAESWIMYAREALGETNYLGEKEWLGKKVVILFDKWFSDVNYRKSLSESLGLEHTDKGVNTPARRVGSSFDGKMYQYNAQKMKVLDRWEYFKDRDGYKDILRNDELIDKTKQLFGVNIKKLLEL